jgi:hypothetical protein
VSSEPIDGASFLTAQQKAMLSQRLGADSGNPKILMGSLGGGRALLLELSSALDVGGIFVADLAARKVISPLIVPPGPALAHLSADGNRLILEGVDHQASPGISGRVPNHRTGHVWLALAWFDPGANPAVRQIEVALSGVNESLTCVLTDL